MYRITRTFLNLMALSAFIGSLMVTAQAAEVPEGVVLSDKQVLVRNNYSEPQTLDPTLQQGAYGKSISLDLFEGLITLGSDGENRPGVASHWEHNANNTEYTFYLRKDAKWSNGKPVTAHDFVYAWRRLVTPATAANYAYYAALAGIKNANAIASGKANPETLGVKAVGDYELKVYLDNPIPYFVSMTAYPALFPIYAPAVQQWGNQWTQPNHMVSNGAYRLSKHVVNGEIVVVRNKQYWNNAKTVIEKVTFLPIGDRVTAMNRFKSGDLDMTYELPGEYFSALKRDMPDSLRVNPFLCTYYYDFNLKKAPLDNADVRKALAYAINRDVIAQYIKKSGEIPAYTLTPPGTSARPDFVPEWATWQQAERVKKAKALLKKSGINPRDIKLTLTYDTNDIHKKIAIAVQQMWRSELGIQVSISNMEWKTFVAARNHGDFEIARDAWCGDYNEASTFMSLGMSNNANNSPKFNDPAYDAIMQQAASSTSIEARKALYNKASRILSEQMPFAPIFYYVNARLVKPYVGNYNPNVLDFKYDKDLYIIKH